MNKLNYNIRIVGYKLLGYFWYSIPIMFLITIWLKKETSTLQLGDKIGITIVIPLVFFLATILLRAIGDIRMFSPSILIQTPKLIYHEKLGYFSGYTFEDNDKAFIKIYKQRILTLRYIGDISISNKIQLQADIKALLDRKYQKTIKDIEKCKKLKEDRDIVKGWDGYLSTKDRRDGKLEKLLKK